AGERSGVLQRPDVLHHDRFSEDTGRDRCGRQTRRQQVPRQGAHRVERRADRQARPGGARRQKHGCDRSIYREDHGDQTMTRFIRGAAALMIVATVAHGQTTLKSSSLDRRTIPTPGKDPALQVPAWTNTTLSNGAKLVVSERHGLPLVSFQINFIGGAAQYEPADKTGLASFVAQMLSEGTTHRTGEQLSSDLQLLGTSIGSSIDRE